MAPPKSRAAANAAVDETNTSQSNGSSLKDGRSGSSRNTTAAAHGRGRKGAAAAAAAAAASASAAATTTTNTANPLATTATDGAAQNGLASQPDGLDAVTTTPGAGTVDANSDSRNDWIDQDLELLDRYKSQFRLPAPSAFTLPYSHIYLGSGIGQYSPTMVARRRRGQALVSRGTLASVVKPHFKALAVNETDVLSEFLYNIKTADKSFRYKGAPTRKR